MNGKSYIIGTSDELLHLEDQYQGSGVIFEAVESNLTYLINESDKTLRDAKVTETVAGFTASTYTVANGSLFRAPEVVKITDSGDVYKGMSIIRDITGNVLTVEDSLTHEAGDKIIFLADPVLIAGTYLELDTKVAKTILVKAVDSSDVNAIVTVKSSGVKKKI